MLILVDVALERQQNISEKKYLSDREMAVN